MTDEGYIKFDAQWTPTPPFAAAEVAKLLHGRQIAYHHHWIGAYPDGIGYGNVSQRSGATDTFYITGSATGNFPILDNRHIAKVTRVAAAENRLWCEGPVVASSESMSHAAIYSELPWVGGILHAHDLAMWQRLLHQVPTTDARAPYGSPEMVDSIIDLIRHTDLPTRGIFVMEGHREGIFTFGKDLEAALGVMRDFGDLIIVV